MDSGAAPGLQGAQRDLERHMRADSLEKHIQSRPKPEELVEKGILSRESFIQSVLGDGTGREEGTVC